MVSSFQGATVGAVPSHCLIAGLWQMADRQCGGKAFDLDVRAEAEIEPNQQAF